MKSNFNAKNYIRPNLNEEEVISIKESFDLLDANGNGDISVIELIQAMKSMGFDTKNPAIYQLVQNLDQEKDGGITFEEYLDMMSFRFSGENAKENIRRAFKFLDDDGNEEITTANLKKIINELGEDFDDEEVSNIIQKNDVDGDGRLTYDDFEKIMLKKTFQ